MKQRSLWRKLEGMRKSLATTVRAQMQCCNILAESTTEYFKRSLTIPFLDYLLSERKERFSVTSILSLLPQIAIKCALDYKLFAFYEKDLPSYSSLPSELHVLLCSLLEEKNGNNQST